MNAFRTYTRLIALPTAASMLLLSTPVGPAQAAMVSTEQVVQHAYPAESTVDASARDRVMNFLKRQDVQDQMRKLGVDPNEALARVSALSEMAASASSASSWRR